MVAVKTARQKLRNYTRYLNFTLEIYRDALEHVNRIVYAEWDNIEPLPGKFRNNFLEGLIHSTAEKVAVYADFDTRFYKFPSYLRRMVIADGTSSIGHLSSHMSAHRKWTEKPKGKEPVFQSCCNSFPVFYKSDMSRWMANGKTALKLYNGSDWIWFILPFEPIRQNRFPAAEGWVRQNPMLVKKDRRWRLHFPFEKKVKLPDKDFTRPVLSVAMGDKSSPLAARHQQTLASLISLRGLLSTTARTPAALYPCQGFSLQRETAAIEAT
ncbi:MAG: hypothetical protein DDT19_00578 [Syntrophomonadaceae bacterium]|nr:hypothetical protein [Bacillota bacterium]